MGLPADQLIVPPKDWAPEWLTSEFSTKIIQALGPETVCFVGGAVRDSLLELAATDIDLATSHTPESVLQLLGDASIKAVPTGLEHGTVTAVLDDQSCEITTLRRDVSTDGRHAAVEFTQDWYADSVRRDFTINALYATPDGRIYDPLGGHADLRDRKVRFIGNAEDRIKEDALRILRFYRFSARFADSIDETGQVACKKLIELMGGLSVERIRDELLKIFTLPAILPTIGRMQESGVLRQMMGAEWQPASIEAYCSNEASLGATINPLVRLYMLVKGLWSAKQVAAKFKLSNQERGFLVNIELAEQQRPFEGDSDIRRSIYLHGADATLVTSVIQGTDNYTRVEKISREWEAPIFPVKGRELIAMGMEVGPAIGIALGRLEQNWIESDFCLSKSQLLKMIEAS